MKKGAWTSENSAKFSYYSERRRERKKERKKERKRERKKERKRVSETEIWRKKENIKDKGSEIDGNLETDLQRDRQEPR